ncbi:MAG: GFA family protein [Alphaproteobacteria bacterium]|nr:GFA family protein [Alphaproteobacteria bacterium]
MELTGGCLCGQVRYRSTGAPLRQFLCHCRDCQRSSGSAFHHGVAVPREGFTLLSGQPAVYRSTADSGRAIARHFCVNCGSGLWNEIELRPGVLGLRAGTLDDPGLVPPRYEIYARSKAGWLVTDVLESHPDMTPVPKPTR